MRTRNVVGDRNVTSASTDSARVILKECSPSRMTIMRSALSAPRAKAGVTGGWESRTPAAKTRHAPIRNRWFDCCLTDKFLVSCAFPDARILMGPHDVRENREHRRPAAERG